MVAAVGGSLLFWARTGSARPVLIATRELPAGARLTEADLAVTWVRADDAVQRSAYAGDARTSLIGKQLAEPAHAYQVLVRAQVATRSLLGPDDVAFTVPLSPATAGGARARPGDAVRVYATLNRGKADTQTREVVSRAIVYDVGFGDGSSSATAGDAAPVSGTLTRRGSAAPTSLTLVVGAAQATELAHARWNGELDVALLPPAPSDEPANRGPR
ncbi:MAG: RcpC/CpaB family pilus assembly protein [Chloroflexota bacterium]|nr:RcpC/CpaB family pilus assembly protein [Chloroflexota bacterium]